MELIHFTKYMKMKKGYLCIDNEMNWGELNCNKLNILYSIVVYRNMPQREW